MNNLFRVAKFTPVWRRLLYIFSSIIFTYCTVLFLIGYSQYLIQNSITLSALESSLANIIGYGKYNTLMNLVHIYGRLMYLFIFIFYMYLFYRSEKKRQYINDLKNVLRETSYVASGNFDYKWTTYDNNLDDLVENINNIVQYMKDAMEEERHIELTKNELITNVSHDLRTPLTSIVGYLRLIEEDRYKDEVALRHYTGIIYEKALLLEQLINELFEYTRMQDNRLVLKKTPINLTEMLGQVIILHKFNFEENNVICRENISQDHLPVLGDGERLARVFDNIINNAINYGKEGKYVDITAEEVAEHIVVTVTNYGKPIPRIDLPHIFERFYRAEKSRAIHTGGSGLGLAIARSIILHHDGTIDVESNVEKTSFIVKLKQVTCH